MNCTEAEMVSARKGKVLGRAPASSDVAIAAPGAQNRALAAARRAEDTVGLAASVVAALAAVVFLGSALLTGELFLHLVEMIDGGPLPTSVSMLTWVSGAVALGGVVVSGASTGISTVARTLQRRRGVMTWGEINAAPTELREPLLAARTAAETIEHSVSYRRGWLLSDTVVAAVLWELAQRVKVSTRLYAELESAAAAAPDASDPEYTTDIAKTVTAFERRAEWIRTDSARLTGHARRAEELDEELLAPARLAERDRVARRRYEQRDTHQDLQKNVT